MGTRKRSCRKPDLSSDTDEVFMQPWFLPRPLSEKIRRLLPSSQFQKMRYYFDDYGCLKCGKRNLLYGTNGMCDHCYMIVRGRIARGLFKRFRRIGAKLDRKPLVRYLERLARAGAPTSP
jgi:hypothetical protein